MLRNHYDIFSVDRDIHLSLNELNTFIQQKCTFLRLLVQHLDVIIINKFVATY